MLSRLYTILNREPGERYTQGIDNTVVSSISQNYFLIIISSVLTKLGDVLSASKTVLAWLMAYLGAPIFLISLLVPIRESGSMLGTLTVMVVLGMYFSYLLPEVGER